MTGEYKLNDVAYMIESNHYIREGKIIHISGDFNYIQVSGLYGGCNKDKST